MSRIIEPFEDDGAYDRAIDELIEAGEYRKGELSIRNAIRRARNKEEEVR